MPAPPLQFAFQGGGAKFVAMLPVAAAISKLHEDGKITLTALAGTSAGAICAALIAARCDFGQLVKFLKREGPSRVAALRETLPPIDRLSPVIKEMGSELGRINPYSPRSWKKMLHWKNELKPAVPFLKSVFIEGAPALDSAVMENSIRDMFKYCKLDVEKGTYSVLENYTTPSLYIAVSNILAGEGVRATGNLRKRVIDSCSVPFALRSFSFLDRSSFVDGGLCNNLPVDYLAANPPVPTFLVYPEEIEGVTRPPVANFFQYAINVVSCPIDHNVKRAKSSVDKAFHIPVYVNFSTFDFDEALSSLRDNVEDDPLYKSTLKTLRAFVATYGNVLDKTHVRVTDTKSISDYEKMLSRATANYEDYIALRKCSILVHVNEASSCSSEEREPDTVTITTEFSVIKEGFRFYRSRMKRDRDGVTPSIWYAKNVTKAYKDLGIRVLTVETDDQTDGFQECVVEIISEDISVGDAISICNVTSRKVDMAGLNMRQNEFMSILNPHAQDYPEAELVCRYPRTLGEYKMIVDSSLSDIRAEEAEISDPNATQDGQFQALQCRAKHLRPKGKFRAEIVAVNR